MRKMLKFFSLFFMVVFVSLAAESATDENQFLSTVKEKYQLTVTEVDPEHHCFKLSNKLICNLTKRRLKADALPVVGDVIRLCPMSRSCDRRLSHIEQGELTVFIKSEDVIPTKSIIGVWISGEDEYPMVLHDVVRINSGGESGADQELVILSDRSGWIRKSKEPTVFAPGDRIIISTVRGVDDPEFLLINMDKNALLKLNDGKTAIGFACEAVVPFNFKGGAKK
ncbi:MAG TPA: hypothetical protein VFU89_02145 [Rhabdochlamydiaceae bacterium]|nr:hypothetical protein [Rhabdochlamydiaceae bacterium]